MFAEFSGQFMFASNGFPVFSIVQSQPDLRASSLYAPFVKL